MAALLNQQPRLPTWHRMREETYREWRNSMNKKQDEISIIRSSAAEYLTFVVSTAGDEDSIEMRYEDENI